MYDTIQALNNADIILKRVDSFESDLFCEPTLKLCGGVFFSFSTFTKKNVGHSFTVLTLIELKYFHF